MKIRRVLTIAALVLGALVLSTVVGIVILLGPDARRFFSNVERENQARRDWTERA